MAHWKTSKITFGDGSTDKRILLVETNDTKLQAEVRVYNSYFKYAKDISDSFIKTFVSASITCDNNELFE
jgi:hypothetical protein